MWSFLEPFRRWFRRGRPALSNGPMTVPVPNIMQQLAATQPVELACDEVLRLMGACAEAVLRGEDHTHMVPLFAKHLDMCPDCREEFEALLRVLRAQPASTAG